MFNLYISPLWVSVFLKGLAWVSPFEAVQINPPPTVIPDPFSVMVGNLLLYLHPKITNTHHLILDP